MTVHYYRSRRGFTLIELLVVIAIIAILAAILFPVFAQAREKARQTSCLSNLKQMGTSTMMYIQDYDECYPQAVGMSSDGVWRYGLNMMYPNGWRQNFATPAPGNFRYEVAEVCWGISLQPYMKNYGIGACPSCSPVDIVTGEVAVKKPENSSYTYNGLMNQIPQAAMPQPADVILFWEGRGKQSARGFYFSQPQITNCAAGNASCVYQTLGRNANGAISSCGTGPGSGGSWYGLYNPNGTVRVHAGGMNIAYADGHAKFKRLSGGTSGDWRTDFFGSYDAIGRPLTMWFICNVPYWFRPDFDAATDTR